LAPWTSNSSGASRRATSLHDEGGPPPRRRRDFCNLTLSAPNMISTTGDAAAETVQHEALHHKPQVFEEVPASQQVDAQAPWQEARPSLLTGARNKRARHLTYQLGKADAPTRVKPTPDSEGTTKEWKPPTMPWSLQSLDVFLFSCFSRFPTLVEPKSYFEETPKQRKPPTIPCYSRSLDDFLFSCISRF